MSDINFACPSCSQHIACDESYRGHHVQCPTCQTDIAVPGGGPAVPPPLPPIHSSSAPPAVRGQHRKTLDTNKDIDGRCRTCAQFDRENCLSIVGTAFGGFFWLLAAACTLGGFILAMVSLFQKDGWVWGIIAIVVSISSHFREILAENEKP